MESKKLKTFQKLLEYISQSPQSSRKKSQNRRTGEEMFKTKLTKN